MSLNYSSLEKNLGYKFNNKELLKAALVHSSYAYEHNLPNDNERMEFLGDAVIHLILTEFLLNSYPEEDEGNLSAIRSHCESESFLQERAREINLGDYILFGRGEQSGGGKNKNSLLANTYEALIAAVHLDGGYSSSKKLILSNFQKHIYETYNQKLFINAKSELQKYTQKKFFTLPIYETIKEDGEDHKKIFTIKVSANNISATAKGTTKKNAEKKAAQSLYKKLTQNEL